MVAPASQSLGEKQEQVKQANVALKDIEENNTALQSLVASINDPENQVKIESLDQALPVDDRVSKLHVMFDQIVRASGMTLANVTISQGETGAAAGEKDEVDDPFKNERKQKVVNVTLGVTGSIEQGVGLLHLIETNPRIIDVEALDVTSDGSGTLSFRLKLKLYYYAPAAAVPQTQPAAVQ